MENWKTSKLNEIAEIIDSLHKTPQYTSEGYPMVRVTDINGGYLKLDKCFNVDEQTYLEFSKRRKSQIGDIIFSRVGTYGLSSYVNSNAPFCLGQNTVFIVPKIDSKFLFYYLNSRYGQSQIHMLATGSTQKTISLASIKNINIVFPEDAKKQAQISSILSSLDDKIETNLQINLTLEEMAKALYKSWFVDFEFTNFDRNLISGIPQNWKQVKLGDLIDSVSVTHKFPKNEIIFLNTSDILDGQILTHEYKEVSTLPGQAKKSIQKNDILYSEIRPANKRHAFIDFDVDDYVVSTKLMVLRAKSFVEPIVIYYFLKNEEIVAKLQGIAESRSGTFPQITFQEIKNLEMIIPSEDILNKYTEVLKAFSAQIRNNNEENRKLIEIRDSLLPKLISGEISVDNLS